LISETVTADRYQQQLYRLNDELIQKRPIIDVVILLHDNTWPHVARIVQETLLELECEVLPHQPRLDPIGLSPFPINATRAHQYTLLQSRKSATMHRSMDCFKEQVVLSSRNPTFAKKIGKSHRKQWIIFQLIY